MKAGLLNVVIFEGGVKKLELLTLTNVIRTQVWEVKYGRIVGDGNLLIGCNHEVQMEKAKKNPKNPKLINDCVNMHKMFQRRQYSY